MISKFIRISPLILTLLSKKKDNHGGNTGNRFLISITVFGSAGPIRFMVNEKEPVAAVIDTALKGYAREGRQPILGSNVDDFILCCPFEVLSPRETIGSIGHRNFTLCKKPQAQKSIDNAQLTPTVTTWKSSGKWKNLFNRALKHQISFH